MQAIKSIAIATFLGAFGLGFIGGFVGALAALLIWPEANLGPPVGALFGFSAGILLGAVLGFVFGIVRLFLSKPRMAHKNSEENEKTPLQSDAPNERHARRVAIRVLPDADHR